MRTLIPVLALFLALGSPADPTSPTPEPATEPRAVEPYRDVPFLESPESVVEAMLELAEVTETDVVYDLGSGDGRIVIAAAERGALGIGIEIDPELVELSQTNAVEAGVEEKVRFLEGDIFESDFSDASVVMMYLYPKVNRRMHPILLEQLAPGTRIVCHRFPIRGWDDIERIKVQGRPIFLYVVPEPGPLGQ